MAENLIRLKQINQADLSGYISSVSQAALMVPNLVYNTGDQTISGIKTFANNIAVSGTGIFNSLDLSSVDTISLSGVDITITNGVVISTNPITAPNLVYNTGNQTISGVKTFSVAGSTIARISQSGLNVVSGNLTLQSGSNLVIATGATILGNNYFWFGTGTGTSVTTTANTLASFFLESGVAYKLESQLTFAAGTNANTISDLNKNPTTFADGIGFRQGSNNSADEPNSPLTGYLQLGYSNVNGSIWGSISGRTNHIRRGIIRPTGGNVTVTFTWGSANGSNSRLLENYILLEKIGRI